MIHPLISLQVEVGDHVVLARQKARDLAAMLGFGGQDQIRVATAVSEIARNALRYAGKSRVDFGLIDNESAVQHLRVSVSDKGSGIPNLDKIMDGGYSSSTGMGLGLLGAQRLMDGFSVETTPGVGTTVTMTKALPHDIPPVGSDAVRQIAKTLFASAPTSTHDELQRQNRELIATMAALRERQDDLTRMARELEDTNRGVVALLTELEAGANHLRRADEMKSRFLSNMSHEFRTPLSSVRALSKLLLSETDGKLGSEQRQQVELIARSTDTLFELVNDLLDLAKIEAGKVVVRAEEVRVDDMFSALRGMLKPLVVSSAVALEFAPANGMSLVSDEGKLAQVLRNFVSNALKFTESGTVTVACQLFDDDLIEFSVTDTGIGIASGDHELIFEEFAQLEHRLQRQVRGTGLGLPLCKKLAELLGGSVSMASTPGVGSRFSIVVPLRPHALPSENPEATAEGERRQTVLVIDDDVAMQAIFSSYFRQSRYLMASATSLREADQILARRKPCALVMDLRLPGEDSWGWLARRRSSLARAGVPIIIVSAYGERHKGLAFGANDFFQKPIDPAVFLAALDRLVDGAGQAS